MSINKKPRLLIVLIVVLIITGGAIILYSLNRAKKLNVILITIDALRPDHLGCYGYPRSTSPNIDRMAKDGTMFTCAIAQSTNTLASVPSFITSTYPYMHFRNSKEHYAYLNPTVNTLQNILKEDGHKTVLFNDYPTYFGRIQGIKENFDTFFEINLNQPEKLTQLVLKWLRQNRKQKFFLWLYYFGVHPPYAPSPYYNDKLFVDILSKTDKYVPVASDDEKEIFGVIPKYLAEDNITNVNYYIAKYDIRISIIDEQIGLLLQELKNLDLEKNTLIILMSDHGESFGEHNLYFHHGFTLFDELLKVPLIMRCPTVIPENKIIDYQVRLIDLVPTITDILNLKNTENKSIEGISLEPNILGKKHGIREFAFSSSGPLFSVRTKDWKLIYRDLNAVKEMIEEAPSLVQQYMNYYLNEYELYNLDSDSRETMNLINKENEIFKNLKQELGQYIIKAKQEKIKAKQLIEKYNEKVNSLDEETKEKLRNLGYINK